MPLPPRALPAGFIAPCLPSSAPQPPSGEEWLHEIKHDGFRLIAHKEIARIETRALAAVISVSTCCKRPTETTPECYDFSSVEALVGAELYDCARSFNPRAGSCGDFVRLP